MPAPTAIAAISQPPPVVPMALNATQSAPQPSTMQLLPMLPMGKLQQLSTSTANLDRYSQPIPKPAQYEHSVKQKTQQQEEVQSRKAHKTCMRDEPHSRRRPLPSTSHTQCDKTPSEHRVKHSEQRAKQKYRHTAGHATSTTSMTAQSKVMPTKHPGTQMKTAQSSVQPQQTLLACCSDSHRPPHELHQHDEHHCHEGDHSPH
uniref:Uncharacterized protein n=1 Tax=Romanomermis culicivorax TaxID=13658 RepID=A0A915HRK6_ROMCU